LDGERAGHSVGQGTCLGGMALAEDMFSSSVGILNFSKCIVQEVSNLKYYLIPKELVLLISIENLERFCNIPLPISIDCRQLIHVRAI